MKRFWQRAIAGLDGGEWCILLDGRPMRLPDGRVLRLDRATLAAAIAAEWQAVGETMSFEDVPLTRLAGTARYRIAGDPAPAVAALARYAETDCLCYRAQHPQALVVRQHHSWQPWLDWAATTYGARLVVTSGIIAVPQPPHAVEALAAAAAALDAWQLTGLGILVPAYGSLVLGLAAAAGALEAGEALTISALDELFQEQQWGQDADATARRRKIALDVATAARFMALAAAS